MKQFGLAVFALMLCAILSSCNSIKPDTNDLLHPPKLTAQQSEIYAALSEAMGDETLTFKYPESGEYRSAFVFYDVDNDKTDEVLTFCTTENSSYTRIILLDYIDGKWQLVFNIPGMNSSIDFVSFSHISSQEFANVIIGWSDEERPDKDLCIYTYENSILRLSTQERYSRYIVQDIDGDKLDDILMLHREPDTRTSRIKLLKKSGVDIQTVSDYPLWSSTASFANISVGVSSASSKIPTVYIDEAYGSSMLATEVLSIVNETFQPVLTNESSADLFVKTQRSNGVLSRDVNADGVIEIPTAQLLPGYEKVSEGDQLYLTDFNIVKDGNLVPVYSAAINTASGYMIHFPPEWVGVVTVVEQVENGEWRFIRYHDSLTDLSEELARIRMRSQQEYQDKFLQEYKLLKTSGAFEYYGFVPANSQSPLAISLDELTQMFTLLKNVTSRNGR